MATFETYKKQFSFLKLLITSVLFGLLLNSFYYSFNIQFRDNSSAFYLVWLPVTMFSFIYFWTYKIKLEEGQVFNIITSFLVARTALSLLFSLIASFMSTTNYFDLNRYFLNVRAISYDLPQNGSYGQSDYDGSSTELDYSYNFKTFAYSYPIEKELIGTILPDGIKIIERKGQIGIQKFFDFDYLDSMYFYENVDWFENQNISEASFLPLNVKEFRSHATAYLNGYLIPINFKDGKLLNKQRKYELWDISEPGFWWANINFMIEILLRDFLFNLIYTLVAIRIMRNYFRRKLTI